MAGKRTAARNGLKCLSCNDVLSPENKWEQCSCGSVYVDTSGDGLVRMGFLDPDKVEGVGDWTPKKGTDEFAKGGTFL